MEKLLGKSVVWSDWLIAGAPWSLIMSVILIVVVLKILPPESNNMAGGKEAVEKSLRDLGPMTGPQKRLMLVSVLLLCCSPPKASCISSIPRPPRISA